MSEELSNQLESISTRLLALSKTQASAWGDTEMANATANDAIAIEHAMIELTRLRTELAASKAEVERLKAGLSMTGDNVPISPGMRVYGSFRDGVIEGEVFSDGSRTRFVPDNMDPRRPEILNNADGDYALVRTKCLYSTREAALAARKEQQ